MSIIIDGGAGVTFPDTVQQTNALTNTGGNPRYYAARAWVLFNGTGTPAVRAGANVASITDNGTGTYTVTFTTPMPDANYAVAATTIDADISGAYIVARVYGTPTTTSFNIVVSRQSSGNPVAFDPDFVSVVVFR